MPSFYAYRENEISYGYFNWLIKDDEEVFFGLTSQNQAIILIDVLLLRGEVSEDLSWLWFYQFKYSVLPVSDEKYDKKIIGMILNYWRSGSPDDLTMNYDEGDDNSMPLNVGIMELSLGEIAAGFKANFGLLAQSASKEIAHWLKKNIV